MKTLAQTMVELVYAEAKKQGLKQSAIAKRSKTSDAYLAHLANKVANGEGMSTRTIEKLADAVGCRVEFRLIPKDELRKLRIKLLEKELEDLRSENG
jgi:transcriptional regulator with XRE-family HTH domain